MTCYCKDICQTMKPQKKMFAKSAYELPFTRFCKRCATFIQDEKTANDKRCPCCNSPVRKRVLASRHRRSVKYYALNERKPRNQRP